tara:strand:- start:499 stop:711 length:213 start_codon:yes stop_codon:yes gene_type:complete
MISTDALLRLFVVLTMMGVEMINSFAVLDSPIKILSQIVIIIVTLNIASLILILKRVEKESSVLLGESND